MSQAHAFLVVDDSRLHHQMYDLVLRRGAYAGSTVHHAFNGREGYGVLQAHPELTAVFLDLNMPEMNGLEFLARRRDDQLHPRIPVIMVTTEASEADEQRGREAGAWDYLRKPFTPADIERVIARAVAHAAA